MGYTVYGYVGIEVNYDCIYGIFNCSQIIVFYTSRVKYIYMLIKIALIAYIYRLKYLYRDIMNECLGVAFKTFIVLGFINQ